jgi:hypothetical protein
MWRIPGERPGEKTGMQGSIWGHPNSGKLILSAIRDTFSIDFE